MKKVLSALLAVVALTMLAASCSTSGSDDDEDGGCTYSVSFKLDGKAYKLTKGLSKTESGTALTGEACAYYSAGKVKILGLQNAYDPTTELGSGDYLSINIKDGTSPGTYGARLVDFSVGDKNYENDGSSEAVEVKISAYGSEGGVVEGTFSGKLDLLDDDDYPTGTQATITEGVFKVIRVPDDAN